MSTSVIVEIGQGRRHDKTNDRKGKLKVAHRRGRSQDRGKGFGRVEAEGETMDMVETRT